MAGNHPLSKINGLKGGRPVGSKSTPHEVKERVLQIYREQAHKLAQEMLDIALDKKNFSPTRLVAIDKIQDRMFGKPPQPHDGDGFGGSIIMQVFTGVPEPEDD
jgi:hypothetical protein